MGTEYVRTETPPTEITLIQGSTTTIDIPHITSALTIGNTLQMNMRQQVGAELDFISLINNAHSTEITINSNNIALGEYAIVLESFDEAN